MLRTWKTMSQFFYNTKYSFTGIHINSTWKKSQTEVDIIHN